VRSPSKTVEPNKNRDCEIHAFFCPLFSTKTQLGLQSVKIGGLEGHLLQFTYKNQPVTSIWLDNKNEILYGQEPGAIQNLLMFAMMS